MRNFSLAYSSCPNDTFIFHALAHRLIPTHDISFQITLTDVETLNQKATASYFDITKLSIATFGALKDRYIMLRTGAALGRGCGPLVVSLPGKMMLPHKIITHNNDFIIEELNNFAIDKLPVVKKQFIKKPIIAVPGIGTTAFVLFSLFMKENFHGIEPEIVPMPFEKIMLAVKYGSVDFGVIIHEGRFIYRNLGLDCLVDLGAWWETKTELPIPLGCIAIKRDIYQNDPDAPLMIQNLIGQSIQYGLDHRYSSRNYIKTHAQEMDDEVIERHIKLYVNEFSKDIGTEGESAITTFFHKAKSAGLIDLKLDEANEKKTIN